MASRLPTRKFGMPNSRPFQPLSSPESASAGEPVLANRDPVVAPPVAEHPDVLDSKQHSNNKDSEHNRSVKLPQEAKEEAETPNTISRDVLIFPYNLRTRHRVNPSKVTKVDHSGDEVRRPQNPEPIFSCSRDSTGWVGKLELGVEEKNAKPASTSYYLRVPKTYIFEDDEDAPFKRSKFTFENVSKHDVTFMIQLFSIKCRHRYINWIPKGGKLIIYFCHEGDYVDILRQRMLVFTTPVLSQEHTENDKLKLYWMAFGSELLPTSVVELQTIKPVARKSGASMLYKISCILPLYEEYLGSFELMEPMDRRLIYEVLFKNSHYVKDHFVGVVTTQIQSFSGEP